MNALHTRQMITLLWREYWEHRIAILWVPAALALLALLAVVWTLLASGEGSEVLGLLASLDQRPRADIEQSVLTFLGLSSSFFLFALAITVPVYLLASLYEDRKTGSSLFWYSMPVSNAITVFSKLLTGVVIMPLLTALILLGQFLAMFLFVALYAWIMGVELPLWMLLSALFSWTLTFTLGVLLLSLWLLPLYGWILLISAYARSAPVFWAIVLVIALNVFERVVLQTGYLATWIDSRGIPFESLTLDRGDLLSRLLNYEMFYGLAIGGLFITGAIYMRRFTD